MNMGEILQLKYPNAVFMRDVIIQDDMDGRGTYISKWDESVLGPKPTQEDLDRWAIELLPAKVARDARESRRGAYPAFGDQLDALYKAMEAGTLPKVPEFFDPIKSVKDAFPLAGKSVK